MSDPQAKDCLYDSEAMPKIVGIALGAEPSPYETIIIKFRHLIAEYMLGQPILAVLNEHIKKHGIKIGNGTIMDASIITAPSSYKNNESESDPEMHQIKR